MAEHLSNAIRLTSMALCPSCLITSGGIGERHRAIGRRKPVQRANILPHGLDLRRLTALILFLISPGAGHRHRVAEIRKGVGYSRSASSSCQRSTIRAVNSGESCATTTKQSRFSR